jgi:hypothetical protein
MKTALVALIALSGCGGSRCKEVQRAREGLVRSGAPNRGADMRLTVPFTRANDVIADLLKQEPMTMPLTPPELGGFELPATLTANVRSVVLQAGSADTARFAIVIDINDGETGIVAMTALLEIAPALVRKPDGAELSIGFGPQNIIEAKPSLAADSKEKLQSTVGRWVPERVKGKIPRVLMDTAARRLASHLTGTAWELMRQTVLKKLGDMTRMRVRLPDVPIAKTALRSTDRALIVDITTDLPVRRGLAPGGDADTEVGLRMSGSTVAELANWAIDKGHAPTSYDRNIKPKTDGEFRPRFDYVSEDRAHPFKVYSFQERGGCSYFKVGVQAKVAVDGNNLKGTVSDQQLEKKTANPLVEVLAWTKYFLIGGLDRSKQVAAHTQLSIGRRTMQTRVTNAAIVDDELRFALALDAR